MNVALDLSKRLKRISGMILIKFLPHTKVRAVVTGCYFGEEWHTVDAVLTSSYKEYVIEGEIFDFISYCTNWDDRERVNICIPDRSYTKPMKKSGRIKKLHGVPSEWFETEGRMDMVIGGIK